MVACTKQATVTEVGTKTSALDDSAWKESQWISVVDAPVVTGRANEVYRAADGASWFLSSVKNEGKVVSAKWMTAGLGVYSLYVNGKPVGEQILGEDGKPIYQKNPINPNKSKKKRK